MHSNKLQNIFQFCKCVCMFNFLYGLAFDSLSFCVCMFEYESMNSMNTIYALVSSPAVRTALTFCQSFFVLFWWCNISPDIIAKLLGIPLLLVFISYFFQRFTVSSPLLAHTMDLSYLLAWFRFIRIKLRLAHVECLEYYNVSNEIDFVV